jgi:hypothetical protein
MNVSNQIVQCPEMQRMEDSGLLSYDTVLLGEWFPAFLQNVGNHSSSDTVSHSRRPEYSISEAGLLCITRCKGRNFPTQLCLRKVKMTMFKINALFIKIDLREI